jgi:hypothetical protein
MRETSKRCDSLFSDICSSSGCIFYHLSISILNFS